MRKHRLFFAYVCQAVRVVGSWKNHSMQLKNELILSSYLWTIPYFELLINDRLLWLKW